MKNFEQIITEFQQLLDKYGFIEIEYLKTILAQAEFYDDDVLKKVEEKLIFDEHYTGKEIINYHDEDHLLGYAVYLKGISIKNFLDYKSKVLEKQQIFTNLDKFLDVEKINDESLVAMSIFCLMQMFYHDFGDNGKEYLDLLWDNAKNEIKKSKDNDPEIGTVQ